MKIPSNRFNRDNEPPTWHQTSTSSSITMSIVAEPAIVAKPAIIIDDAKRSISASINKVFGRLPHEYHSEIVKLIEDVSKYTLQYGEAPPIRKRHHVHFDVLDTPPPVKRSKRLANRLDEYLDVRIPRDANYMIYDVNPDGNCGFRSLAVAMYDNEEEWQRIKREMKVELDKHDEFYRNWLGYDIDKINKIITWNKASHRLPDHWFCSPECAQLAADTYKARVAVFSTNARDSLVFLPFDNNIEKTIVLQHVGEYT
ncbi:hypothetical protein BC938DRAFT_473789 [Jimgerdemannia flammicorona]|uniref:OTU domain-containing protein n=1 Tax=Jimgerdemannia flammicorona TaxID=994334 RepID=A0A433QZN5_9FUNG|nr:hypothetical protein BC938DRAFT_473789 [Jimgerdemannia flammicorona]